MTAFLMAGVWGAAIQSYRWQQELLADRLTLHASARACAPGGIACPASKLSDFRPLLQDGR
jgi:hypothetical protein